MLFRPPDPASLWDTWLFIEPPTAHLFFLRVSNVSQSNEWDSIGHATSNDLVHWKEIDPIPLRTEAPAWDSDASLTGSTFRYDGRYWMFYGSSSEGRNLIGLLVSDDLIHWTKIDSKPVLCPVSPYHHQYGGPVSLVDWRDPVAYWREELNQWEILLAARQEHPSPGTTGACVGRLLTKDFKTYTPMDPVAVPPGFFNCEVPDYFELNGWHYILFSSFCDGGGPCRFDTASRYRPIGTWYVRAKHRDGPYSLPEDPFLVGSGHKTLEAYVGRTTLWQGQRLLYHHMALPRPAWALPKAIENDEHGNLMLKHWPGNNELRLTQPRNPIDRLEIDNPYLARGSWSVDGNNIVGKAGPIKSTILLQDRLNDFELSCVIDASGAALAGVVFHLADDAPVVGGAIALHADANDVELNRVEWTIAHSLGLNLHDACHLTGTSLDQPAHLRMIVRDRYIDVYINDQWCLSNLLEQPREGSRIGLIVAGGSARFRDLKLYPLPAMDA